MKREGGSGERERKRRESVKPGPPRGDGVGVRSVVSKSAALGTSLVASSG